MSQPEGSILAACATGLVAVIGYVARKFITTATEKREEQAKRDMISTLERERDTANKRADEADARADEERELRTRAEMHNIELAGELTHLRHKLAKMMRRLDPEEREFFETDVAPFDALRKK